MPTMHKLLASSPGPFPACNIEKLGMGLGTRLVSYLLQLVESVDLIDEEYGVSLEHDLFIPSHLDNLLDVLHSGCGGRQLHKLCTQLLVGYSCYDPS